MVKIEELKFIIKRIDDNSSSVNLKGSVFLAANTFLIGSYTILLKGSTEIHTDQQIFSGLSLMFSVISIVFVLLALLPYLYTGNNKTYRSKIYFGSIYNTELEVFKKEFQEMNDQDFIDDLLNQSHVLSSIYHTKFVFIRNAGISLFISILLSFLYHLTKY